MHVCFLSFSYRYMYAYLGTYMHLVPVLHTSTYIIRVYVFLLWRDFSSAAPFTTVLQVQRKSNLCCPGIHLRIHSRPFLGFSVAVALFIAYGL